MVVAASAKEAWWVPSCPLDAAGSRSKHRGVGDAYQELGARLESMLKMKVLLKMRPEAEASQWTMDMPPLVEKVRVAASAASANSSYSF